MGLERVSLSIDRGEFVFLVGPTGCGKSTFIKLLIRELEPDGGAVRIAGRNVNEMARDRIPYLRRRIGTIFQDFKLLPDRTVYDNVAFALHVIGGTRRKKFIRNVPRTSSVLSSGLAGKITGTKRFPMPAVRRRAAARLGGARVRQPSPAASGR